MATDDALRGLFGKLDPQLRNNQPKKALKTVEEILKAAPGDLDALRCKAVLLIELDNFEEALRVISSNQALEQAAFEKAYCLYRLGRAQDALSALSSAPRGAQPPAAAWLQLEAQLHYRLGAPKEAIRCYSSLFQQHGAEGMEVRTNVLAAYLAGGKAGEVPAVMEAMKITPEDSFEVAFNAACALVEAGSVAKAQAQLQLAQRLGEESLYEEDLGEAEVALELAPVSAQLAYVAARLGQAQEATQALQDLLALPLDDEATAAVAASNLCALALAEGAAGEGGDGKKAAGEGLKRLDALVDRAGGLVRLKKSLDARLGPAQKEALLSNYAAAALVAGKGDVAKDAIRGLERAAPSSPSLPLLQASQLAGEKRVGEADAVLAAAAAAGGSSGLSAGLMRVQLAAAGGDAAGALRLLKALPGVQSQPGVVATQAALLQQVGSLSEAAALLSQALKQQTPGSAAATWILSRLSALELRAGQLKAARDHLSVLLGTAEEGGAADAGHAELLARYARITALCDPASAAAGPPAQLSGLPKAPALPPQEVDALENANVALAGGRRRGADAEPAVPVPAAMKKKGAAEGEAVKQAKKRKRKKRLPKGFDPANPGPPPDPERWLPKWQRSDAKKKHKRRHREKEAVKGSQGAGKVDESLDRTNVTDDVEMSDAAKPKLPPKPAGKGKKGGKGRR